MKLGILSICLIYEEDSFSSQNIEQTPLNLINEKDNFLNINKPERFRYISFHERISHTLWANEDSNDLRSLLVKVGCWTLTTKKLTTQMFTQSLAPYLYMAINVVLRPAVVHPVPWLYFRNYRNLPGRLGSFRVVPQVDPAVHFRRRVRFDLRNIWDW